MDSIYSKCGELPFIIDFILYQKGQGNVPEGFGLEHKLSSRLGSFFGYYKECGSYTENLYQAY